MKQKPLFIAFSTQKGGAGKSTFTALASSLLHYAHGYNVAVIDCDYPQCSIYEMRKREIRQLENNLLLSGKGGNPAWKPSTSRPTRLSAPVPKKASPKPMSFLHPRAWSMTWYSLICREQSIMREWYLLS